MRTTSRHIRELIQVIVAARTITQASRPNTIHAGDAEKPSAAWLSAKTRPTLIAQLNKIMWRAWRCMQARSWTERPVDAAALALNSPRSKPIAGPTIAQGTMPASTPLAAALPAPAVARVAAAALEGLNAGKAASTATVNARLGRVRVRVV